jgi:hypothetical protein
MPHLTHTADERVVVAGDQEPWLGVTFDIAEHRFIDKQPDKRFLVATLMNGSSGQQVGLALDMLLTGWALESTDDPRVFYYHGDVRLRGTGPPTENLAELVEANSGASRFGGGSFATLHCNLVALCCDPLEIETTRFCGKLFLGRGDDPAKEAQLFLALNIPARQAWFIEKDPCFRPAIAAYLRGAYQ